mmetsp:Transcript_39533/g.113790  ORF Transcript_39533/g.113790 Transcript_39533/m.113790 type:complete len:300 (-) Transcript_39533:131-1030(-)
MQLITTFSATVDRFAASGFARGFLRSLFGELGDKTFFVALVFAAWCPWDGPRDVDHITGHRFVVFLATWFAISAHAMLAASVRASEWASWSDRGNWVLEMSGGLLFALLSVRAYLGATRSMGRTTATLPGISEAEPLLPKPEVQYNRDAFSYPVSGPSFSMGGGLDDGGESAEAAHSTSKLGSSDSGFTSSVIVSLLATSLCAFVAEAEDKSWYALVDGGRQGMDLVAGAVLGFVPGVALAVGLGVVMWWQLETGAIRLVAMLAFLALSLISFSQALLHLDALDIGLSPVPAASPRVAR